MKLNKLIPTVAIYVGFFYVLLGIAIVAFGNAQEVIENGFTGIYAGLAYAGFGCILKYVADKKATFISLLGLALVTIVIVIQPNVTSGALTVQLLSLAYLVIIVKDLIEVSKLLRGKK